MNGKLYIVGIGFPSLMSELAKQSILSADIVVGYNNYVDEIRFLLKADQKVFANGMRQEHERVTYAVESALKGSIVAIVCSGDPSLYGMASLAYEIAEGRGLNIAIIPSVTSALAASAKLGAVVSDDLVLMSLSDQLTPWETIVKRVDAVNMGDFVCALYNPKSLSRVTQLPYTLKKFFDVRGDLYVGAVKNVYRKGEEIKISKISTFDYDFVDMFTIVLVGNSKTKLIDASLVTPRGYKV